MRIEKRENQYFDFPKYFDDEMTRFKFDMSLQNIVPKGMTLPAVNIDELEEGYLIEMAAPGLEPENFEVDLRHDILTITANAPAPKTMGATSRRREHNYQAFKRTVRLPANVLPNPNIEAVYDKGILEIIIPKAA